MSGAPEGFVPLQAQNPSVILSARPRSSSAKCPSAPKSTDPKRGCSIRTRSPNAKCLEARTTVS